jgi:hypothetical protein
MENVQLMETLKGWNEGGKVTAQDSRVLVLINGSDASCKHKSTLRAVLQVNDSWHWWLRLLDGGEDRDLVGDQVRRRTDFDDTSLVLPHHKHL